MNGNMQRQRLMQANAETDVLMKQFYGYSARFFALAAGGNATGSFSIQADSAFMLQNLCGVFFEGGQDFASQSAPKILVQLTDTGSGANIFDQFMPLNNVFGDAKEPFILPTPRILSANSVVQVSVQSQLSIAGDLYLSFLGRKLYGYTNI